MKSRMVILRKAGVLLVGYNGDELSRLSLVCVLEVLHFFVFYYIYWNFRNLHNCLEFSYKGTHFSAQGEKSVASSMPSN